MTADVVRLLGERIMTAPPHPQWSPTTDLVEMLTPHLAGVVAPLLERAAAEAAADVKAAVEAVLNEMENLTSHGAVIEGDFYEATERLRAALDDVPAPPAEAARLRELAEALLDVVDEASADMALHNGRVALDTHEDLTDAARELRDLLDGGAQ